MYNLYQVNPDGFLVSLASLAEEAGGWPAYGAERLMIEVAGGNLTHPAYSRIMDTVNFMSVRREDSLGSLETPNRTYSWSSAPRTATTAG